MKHITLLTCVSTILFLAGCINTETVIKVKKDGGGTLTEIVLLSNTVTEMIEGMASSFGADSTQGNKEEFNLLDEDKLKEDAKKMGEGVTFVSAEEIKTEKAAGYKAIFSFSDINKLKINQNPGENLPSKPGEEKTAEPEYISFEFKKGKVSTLKIKRPEPKEKESSTQKEIPEKTGADSAKVDDQTIEAMKNMFGGMRIAVLVEIEGEITKTNATHVDGNCITIMEMDFAKLMEIPEKLKEFAASNPRSVEDVQKMVKDVPGIKVDLNDEIVVKFK
jgi:hypothetical protein